MRTQGGALDRVGTQALAPAVYCTGRRPDAAGGWTRACEGGTSAQRVAMARAFLIASRRPSPGAVGPLSTEDVAKIEIRDYINKAQAGADSVGIIRWKPKQFPHSSDYYSQYTRDFFKDSEKSGTIWRMNRVVIIAIHALYCSPSLLLLKQQL